MKRIFLIVLSVALTFSSVRADEGMWLPSLIGTQIKDMKSKGFKLSAKDIYDINQASLKDAIVLFGSGCTGELVSNEGLLLTNHHCGYKQIQNHSTIERDYLTNGFWAMSKVEELPNPDLSVKFLIRMDDVTQQVLKGVTDNISDKVRADLIKKNTAEVEKAATEGTHFKAKVESLYYGNQYFIFVYEVFTDVRLVAAPPSSIGKFGGDTDNWMWPRHTGDFSVFRIYANKENKPADYSKENIPYCPKKFFKISTKGIKEGDFTFVYGFPGTTKEYLVSDAVDYVLNYSNPAKIALRTIRLDIIKTEQEKDPAVRIAYAAKCAGIANAWKKWQGESLGLARLGTIGKKQAFEDRFTTWAQDKPDYKNLISEFKTQYEALKPHALARDYYTEAIIAIELIKTARDFYKSKLEGDALKNEFGAFYKDYYEFVDRQIAKRLVAEYEKNLSAEYFPQEIKEAIAKAGGLNNYIDWLFENSSLVDKDKFDALFADEDRLKAARENDPAIEFFKAFDRINNDVIAKPYTLHNGTINKLYTPYMKGLMEFDKHRHFFPDANLTLRVAYGHVEGYHPEDGVTHLPYATLDGIIEKDNPAIYDYNIPQRLRDLYAKKDYGRWAVNGTVPVAFLATNHTTGGNSGSPVLNGHGELLGLNFDRTWLSTMSDIEFDPVMCRNIAVDIRYVLFVIDKVGGAGYLIDEMTLK